MKQVSNVMWVALVGLGVSLAALGCKKNEPAPEPTGQAPEPAEQPAVNAAVPAQEAAKLEVALTEDFEEQATEAISSANLESELDKLDAEISSPE
jgi:hypothetical protein